MNKLFGVLLSIAMLSSCTFALEDTLVDSLDENNIEQPRINLDYNYQNTTKIPIKIKITETSPSDEKLAEGSFLKFRVIENARYKNKIIAKKGDICTARVETTISKGMNGIPASIIIGDFSLNNIDKNKLTPEYEKFGLDLSLFVFPLKWALTPFPPTGSLTNFILGGYAKIKTNNVITIYYYPN